MDRELQMRVTALEHALRILLEELDAKGTLARTTMLRRLEEFEQSSGSLSHELVAATRRLRKSLGDVGRVQVRGYRSARHSTTGGYGRA